MGVAQEGGGFDGHKFQVGLPYAGGGDFIQVGVGGVMPTMELSR